MDVHLRAKLRSLLQKAALLPRRELFGLDRSGLVGVLRNGSRLARSVPLGEVSRS